MIRIGAALLVICAACGGDDGPGGGTGPDATTTVSCEAQLALNGTLAASSTPDPANGCQPAGTWTVTVTVADMGKCTAVPLHNPYTYTVTSPSSGPGTQIAYNGSGESTLGINGDEGRCNGSFDHIVPNGSNFDDLHLKPRTPPFTDVTGTQIALTGTGTYMLLTAHP
jgi:hypothetical protein